MPNFNISRRFSWNSRTFPYILKSRTWVKFKDFSNAVQTICYNSKLITWITFPVIGIFLALVSQNHSHTFSLITAYVHFRFFVVFRSELSPFSQLSNIVCVFLIILCICVFPTPRESAIFFILSPALFLSITLTRSARVKGVLFLFVPQDIINLWSWFLQY